MKQEGKYTYLIFVEMEKTAIENELRQCREELDENVRKKKKGASSPSTAAVTTSSQHAKTGRLLLVWRDADCFAGSFRGTVALPFKLDSRKRISRSD